MSAWANPTPLSPTDQELRRLAAGIGALTERVEGLERLLGFSRPQRQDSLSAQLRDVIDAAAHMGCYDAADWIRDRQIEAGE